MFSVMQLLFKGPYCVSHWLFTGQKKCSWKWLQVKLFPVKSYPGQVVTMHQSHLVVLLAMHFVHPIQNMC